MQNIKPSSGTSSPSVKICRFKFLFLLLFFFINLFAAANPPQTGSTFHKAGNIKFDRITIEQGLSQNSVTCILQDSMGFMWFGTRDGLNRYDGYGFSIYRHDPENQHSLSSNTIFTLYEDQSGKIWIGTRNGLNRFDRRTEQFTRYNLKRKYPEIKVQNFISSIIEDPHRPGILWVGTNGGGLFLLDAATGESVQYTGKLPQYPPDLFNLINEISDSTHILASITQVGNDIDSVRSFRLTRPTQVIILSVGEGNPVGLYDYGWLENGKAIWKMGMQKTRHAGGAFKNRVEVDLFELPPGTYRLHYRTDDSHGFGVWNDLPPDYPNFWGIQVIAISREQKETIKNNLWEYHENSLPDNIIKAIIADRNRDGRFWLGTYNGLSRMDRNDDGRVTFTNYLPYPKTTYGSRLNSIRSLYQDSDGILWIGSAGGGMYKFDPRSKRFTHYLINPEDVSGHTHNDVISVYRDSYGTLWAGTDGGGLYEFNPATGRFIPHRSDPGNPHSLSSNYIRYIYEDLSGGLWVGTWGGGVNKFYREKPQFIHYQANPNTPNSLSGNRILDIFEDRRGIIWIGTDGGGLNRFDPQKNEFTHFRGNPKNPNSLSNNYVISVYEDREGNLWIGTWEGGLSRMIRDSQGKVRFVNYRADPNNPRGLSNNTITSIIESVTLPGVLWLGTFGSGITRFDYKANRFTHFTAEPADPNSLSINYITYLYEAPGEPGILWIGTRNGGLNRFDIHSGRFSHYKTNSTDTTSLSSNYITTIFEDPAGQLWIGTSGGGLNRFDRKTERFYQYGTEDGLSSDVIYGILSDEEGNLWISTPKGLCKFNPSTQRTKIFDLRDGLQANEFTLNACCQSKDGILYFGGINGISAFLPRDIKENRHIPPLVITDFKIFNRPVKMSLNSPLQEPVVRTKEISLSHRENMFSIEFAALDYLFPEKNRYAYKLEGFDQDWIYSDASRRFATYTNLPGGEYLFRVKGSNNDGFWNEKGTSIKIIIHPPFWKNWWFRLLIVILLGGLAYAAYRRREMHVRVKTELRAAHDAQMSIMPQEDPHPEGWDVSGICLPANEVGGDFFDYIWLDGPGRRLCIAVGDVSGKAMKAAMTAVMSNGMIYSGAQNFHSIKDILSFVNQSVYQKTDRNMFTALCLAAINLSAKTLTFANAGLNEPLLKRNGQVTALKSVGCKYPLGIVQKNCYDERTVALQSGDLLLFYTDGIPEERNSAKEFYGYERLIRLVEKLNDDQMTAREIKDRIVLDVKNFSRGTPQHDDMTVVVVKVD